MSLAKVSRKKALYFNIMITAEETQDQYGEESHYSLKGNNQNNLYNLKIHI